MNHSQRPPLIKNFLVKIKNISSTTIPSGKKDLCWAAYFASTVSSLAVSSPKLVKVTKQYKIKNKPQQQVLQQLHKHAFGMQTR